MPPLSPLVERPIRLAARPSAARLWLRAAPVPFLPALGWRAIAAIRPEAAMAARWLLTVTWFLIGTWLAAGVFVAAAGWWGYARNVNREV